MVPLPTALLLGAVVALAAWRAGTLSPSGAVAAAAVGATTLIAAGWWGGVLLLTFFIGSSALSRFAPDPAAERGEAKGGERDAGQVFANGGAPVAGVALALLTPGASIWVLAAGLAAAAADTWATALGATSTGPTRHLFTGRVVTPGTSGGVTWRGTLGGIIGAGSLALVTWIAMREPRAAVVVLVLGTSGMLLDSALGATVQGRFHCPACDVTTERAVHRCGTAARRIGGIGWLTNDGVNALSTLIITAAGWWCWWCWHR